MDGSYVNVQEYLVLVLKLYIKDKLKVTQLPSNIVKFCIFQNCKAYVKKSLQYVPILGWAWRFAEYIFMERNWEKDKEVITFQIKELVNYPDSISVRIFLLIFNFNHLIFNFVIFLL